MYLKLRLQKNYTNLYRYQRFPYNHADVMDYQIF